MSRARMVAINGDKLKNLILATDMTLADASEKMGYSRDYLSGVCRENKASAQCMSLIALMLMIPQDHYIVKEPEPEPEPEEPNDVLEILKRISKDMQTIIELMKEGKDEQKTWRLPFGNDPGDSRSCDDNAGIDGDLPF